MLHGGTPCPTRPKFGENRITSPSDICQNIFQNICPWLGTLKTQPTGGTDSLPFTFGTIKGTSGVLRVHFSLLRARQSQWRPARFDVRQLPKIIR